MKLSNRVLEMEESVTLAANARAKALAAEGRDILSLTLGQPDFATPKTFKKQQSHRSRMVGLALYGSVWTSRIEGCH